jgi:hypothetical protein
VLMTKSETNPQKEPTPLRATYNNHIRERIRRGKIGQRVLTGLAGIAGAAAVVLHVVESDEAALIALSTAAAPATAGAVTQSRTRHRTSFYADQYIAGLTDIEAEQPKQAPIAAASPTEASRQEWPWHRYTTVYSTAASLLVTAGPYLYQRSEEAIAANPYAYDTYAHAKGMALFAVGVAAHIATELSLVYHEVELMKRMDAAEEAAAAA